MNSDTNEPFDLEQIQEIAEEQLGSIVWHGNEGDLDHCPGNHLHTTPSKHADCKIYLDNVPTIFCFHSSCKGAVAEANHELRSAIGKARCEARPQTTEEKLAMLRKRQKEQKAVMANLLFKQKAQRLKQRVLTQYAWSLEEALADSPEKLPENPRDHWRLLLTLFDPAATIWIGNLTSSGGRDGKYSFRTAAGWLEWCLREPPGKFICPAVFAAGSTSRSEQNVRYNRFLVVESDTLTKPEVLAVFRWCRQFLPLCAIIDTAGKSLHGWFDKLGNPHVTDPEHFKSLMKDLKRILPGLGCDESMFRLTQVSRLPGPLRDGRRQRLIWFDRSALRR